MKKRWNVLVCYRDVHSSVEYDVEELSELEDKIEKGPDWRLIDKIVVRLSSRADNRPSPELIAYLDGVAGAVEADSFAAHMLWVENRARDVPLSWANAALGGYMHQVGTVGNMPVMVSLMSITVDGRKLLFFHATSQVVDHRMIDAWLEAHLPASARRKDGSVNRTDAMNFSNVLR